MNSTIIETITYYSYDNNGNIIEIVKELFGELELWYWTLLKKLLTNGIL